MRGSFSQPEGEKLRLTFCFWLLEVDRSLHGFWVLIALFFPFDSHGTFFLLSYCFSLKASPFGDQIDENGRVKVDEFFNLPGHPNVFAIGDVTNLKVRLLLTFDVWSVSLASQFFQEAKQGSFSLEHAKKLALNLKLKEKEGENSPLIKPYVPNPDIAIVSLGRYNGVAQLPSPMGTVSGFLPAMYKSRGLFVEKTRKDLGLTF